MIEKYFRIATGKEVQIPEMMEISLPVSITKGDLLITEEKITRLDDPDWRQAIDRYMYIIEGALPAEEAKGPKRSRILAVKSDEDGHFLVLGTEEGESNA